MSFFTYSFYEIEDAGSVCPSLTFFQLMCTIEDLKEMGIPLGPRKKIAKFVKERVSKQVCVSLIYLRDLLIDDNDEVTNTVFVLVLCTQAARQAALEKKAEVKEVSQVAAPPPAVETPPDSSVMKLPVGNSVSSIHVNYNYFEVGTGQVNVTEKAAEADAKI